METVYRNEKIHELFKSDKYKLEDLRKLQDSILDDLYLKQMIETGKLSKDEVKKPWVTNYKNIPTRFVDIDKSLYQNYVEANKDNPNGVAIYDSEKDRIIKHNELKDLVDAFANGLLEYGIDNNSRVGVLVFGSYEEPMCLLSPNKNGTLVKYLDILKGPGSIKHDIEISKINMLLIDEIMLPIEPMINDKNLPVVILNPTKDYSGTKYISSDKLLSIGASKPLKEAYVGDNSTPSVIINSSGTTGIPKPIVHSNKTINTATQKVFFTDYPLTRNNYVYKSIPSHIGLGLFTTLYSGLVSGTGVLLNHNGKPEDAFVYTLQILKEYKNFLLNHDLDENSKLLLFTSPMFFRVIYDNIDKYDDLSFLTTLLGAGSKMSKEELEVINKAFEERGCPVNICNGYGQNENAGAVALNTNSSNIYGSAGYPVIGTEIKVVNIDTFEEVPTYTEGRILEKSDSEFLYYEGMENETNKAKIVLPDGSEWFDSKDLGYFDENGHVFITGRASRVLIRSDLKISMDAIESKIKSHPAVRECAIITQKTNGVDEDPIAYIILNEMAEDISSDELVNQIQNSKSKLSEFEMPIEFNIVKELPYLSSGKIDYKQLSLSRK